MVVRAEPDRLARFVSRIASEWDADGARWREVDASLCFVDISGFTNLSERLARLGRIGAEELTEVLNRVFGRMLDLAFERGGALLKFGGDALLLEFDGPDHATQAACAAVEMRAALRKAVEVPTSVGRVALRMSVGVHSGTVHLFRVGALHHELVITGPGASRTTEMEATASAGEILVSPETAARLPRGAATRAVGPGRLLRWRQPPVAPVGARPRRAVPPAAIEACLPELLRAHLRDGAPEFEHRFASVGFVKFTGTDALIAGDGPGATADALDDLATSVQRAAHDEGVAFLASDLDNDGGKFILVSGVPASVEDGEGRMLRALRRIAERDYALKVKAGVNRGHVFAGTVGAAHRATYTVMGDTVNLAARLMSAAQPGEVLATAGVLEPSRTAFAVEAVPPFMVKGKSQPVHAFRVGYALGRAARSRTATPFRGRDDELRRLTAALRAPDACVVEVTGESGAGKSRLVEEAVRASERSPLTVRGEPNGAATPYLALRDGLRELLGIEIATRDEMGAALHDTVERRAPQLLPMLPLLADAVDVDVAPTPEAAAIEPQFRPARLADAVTALLARVLDAASVVVVEDAQWVDTASGELLDRLLADRHWPVVVVRRTGKDGFAIGDAHTDALHVALGPLAPPDCREIVLEALPTIPLRPQEIDRLVQRSAGNPMFLAELIRFVRERGDAREIPDSLDAAITVEIDALPPVLRSVLRHAAVLGLRFRPSVLRVTLGAELGDLVDDALVELDRFVEVDGDDSARFRQPVLHDAAYEGLSYRRRNELHLQAAEVIERLAGDDADRDAESLSHHFHEAREYQRSWHYARLAAEAARAAYANIDAAAHYRRAIDAARRLDRAHRVDARELSQTWSALGDVLEQAGVLDGALDAYRRAYTLAGDDPAARVRLLVRRARARERAGACPAALRELTQAERVLDRHHDELPADTADRARVAITTLRAIVREAQEQPAAALPLALDAAAGAERLGEREELAKAYAVVDWAYVVLGEPERAVHTPEIVSIYEALGQSDRAAGALGNDGAVAFWLGRWSDALDRYRRAEAAYVRAGDVVNAAIQQSNIGEVLVCRAQYDDADAPIRDSVRTHRAVGFVDGALFSEVQLGRLQRGRGEHDAALTTLTRVRDEAASLHLWGSALLAAIHLAECLVDLRRSDDALTVLADAERQAGADAAVYAASVALMRALALSSARRTEEATVVAAEGIETARRIGMVYELGLLLVLHAALVEADDPQRASEERGEGAALLGSLEVPVPGAAVSG